MSESSRLRRWLVHAGIDLRAGEARLTSLLFVGFMLVVTFQYVAKTIRQSTFIDSLGAVNLPWVYLAVALCSFPLLKLYERLGERSDPRRWLGKTCWVVLLGTLLFWWLYGFAWRWVPAAFYVFVTLAFGATISQFWSFANQLFDPRQARRLFGFVGAGGLLGGIAGGQVARWSVQWGGTRSALLVAAVLVAVAALLFGRAAKAFTQQAAPRETGDIGGSLLLTVLRSRQLRLIALVLALSVVVAQVIDLQFNWAVERETQGLAQRAAYYGNFFSIVGLAAFAFQMLFTARIHRMAGVSSALRVLPVTLGLGTVALLAAAGFAPELLITAALALKIGDSGLRHSLDQSTRELLFLPVPTVLRARAKLAIDLFVQRGARGVAALLLLPVTFGWIGAVQAGWLTLVVIVVWLVAAAAVYRVYVAAFRTGLKERSVDTAVPVNLDDAKTVELLVQSLGSTDPRQVLHSVELLEANGRANLVPPLLLYHDDPEVRHRTLGVLARAGRKDATPLVERRLQDEHPDVRAEAIRVLTEFDTTDACELMRPRLNDRDPRVRAAAVACLVNHGDEDSVRQATRALEDMLSDAAAEQRAEAVRAIGAIHHRELHARLIRALDDSDTRVAREAVLAVKRVVLRDGFDPLFVPRLISMLRDRKLKLVAREALVACGPVTVPILVHFMNDPDESIFVRRSLPKALAQIGGREALAALVAALETTEDGFLRGQLVEALATHREELVASPECRRSVERAIEAEARRWLERLSEVTALGAGRPLRFDGPVLQWDPRELDLLTQMVAERMQDHLRTTFGLLALVFPPRDIWAAYRSLLAGRPDLRAHALEYLDNTLAGEVRRNVFAVIDDRPLDEKLRDAERWFGIRSESRLAAVRRFLAADPMGNEDARALLVAGLYTVYTEGLAPLHSSVEHWRTATEDPLIRETAEWVAARLDATTEEGAP